MSEPATLIEALMARIDGPLSFRLLIQPAVAIFFAIRDGRRDARDGSPPFFWALWSHPGHRRLLLRSGWLSVGKVFIIALILDTVFQFLVFRHFRPVGALIVAALLVIVPYLLLRGPINRLSPRPAAGQAASARAGEP